MSRRVIRDRGDPAAGPGMSVIAPKAEVNSGRWRRCGGLLRVDGFDRAVIQAPKPEPGITRYGLSDYEWTAIKPMLPNKPCGVRRVMACQSVWHSRRVRSRTIGYARRFPAPCCC